MGGFMTLVPSGRVRLLTRAGANSIYIYFGQLYPMILCLVGATVFLKAGYRTTPSIAVMMSYTCVIAVWALLSQPCFKCCCRPCIEPRVEGVCVASEDVEQSSQFLYLWISEQFVGEEAPQVVQA